ncbi:MAG TPA: ribonuclease HII [Pyrinomonadaceae bacterium]|nr:ribonuclease HII [Pyrinomonadaceae bacterium]
MTTLERFLQKSIPELRNIFLDRGRAVPKGLVEALEVDSRQGAQQLAKRIRQRRRSNRAEGQRLHTLLRFEIDLWLQGFEFIAGVDEAGMAPLAGPVVAGAVILPRNYKLRGLNDSKKILDEDRRGELAVQIKKDAICWAVGFAEVEEIDTINIYHAGLLAMQRAVLGLSCAPQFVLVDARKIPNCPAPQRGIIRGDALSASIAAASIIAKTTRDAHMIELDAQYSGYGLASHKGYPTPEHCRTLKELGALPIHRRSFARVRQALGLDPVQESLFELEVENQAHGEQEIEASVLSSVAATSA